MSKTTISRQKIEAFLGQKYADSYQYGSLTPLTEGLESQAFKFVLDSRWLVFRLNRSDYGFQKDLLCYKAFGDSLPIPEITDIGQFDDSTFYCISQFVAGETLQDLSETALAHYLRPTFDLLMTIREQPITHINGYGRFDLNFQAEFATRDAYLQSVIKPEKTAYREIYAEYEQLLPFCTARHDLIHGDFGSNNVLVKDRQISAIIDWDCVAVGDYLMDVAGAYFWSHHLLCMEKQATFYEAQLSTIEPYYHERIRCYQLMIGLSNLHDYEADADARSFIEPRLFEILNTN